MGEYSREVRHGLVLLPTTHRGMVDRRQSLISLSVTQRVFAFCLNISTTSPRLSMPPKKKTKLPSRAAPADADSPLPEVVTFDGWTDEQETTLFKAISVYRLKPAGELYQTMVPD